MTGAQASRVAEVAPSTAGLDWACRLLFESDGKVVARRRGQSRSGGLRPGRGLPGPAPGGQPAPPGAAGLDPGGRHRPGPKPRRHVDEGPAGPGRTRRRPAGRPDAAGGRSGRRLRRPGSLPRRAAAAPPHRPPAGDVRPGRPRDGRDPRRAPPEPQAGAAGAGLRRHGRRLRQGRLERPDRRARPQRDPGAGPPGRHRPKTFTPPALIAGGPWGDLELIAASALPNAARPDQAQVFDPPMAVIAEIADLWGRSTAQLADSQYWAGRTGTPGGSGRIRCPRPGRRVDRAAASAPPRSPSGPGTAISRRGTWPASSEADVRVGLGTGGARAGRTRPVALPLPDRLPLRGKASGRRLSKAVRSALRPCCPSST